MREIRYHNDEIIKVDGLHFYGCSYVAGQELLDKELPDPMAIDPKKMAKQEGEPQDEYYRRRLSRELLWKKKIKLEKQHAWPQHMCSLLKVRCYNHGQHGSSMTQMKGNIVQHIIDGLYEPNEAIVVGLTGFAREMVFAEDETLLYHLRKHGAAVSMVIASDYERRGDKEFALKYMNLKGTYTYLWFFLHEIWNIMNICVTNNVKLYILPMLDPFNLKWYRKQYDIDYKTNEFNTQLKFLMSEIDKYMIKGMKIDPLGANIIERLPRGHPCAKSHEKFGIKVGEKLLI